MTTWCRFEHDNSVSYGIKEGDSIVKVEGIPWGEHKVTSTRVPFSKIKLLVPVIPNVFYAAGQNYRDHITWFAAKHKLNMKFPTKIDIGYRSNSALLADGENIVRPKGAGHEFECEGELVAVIGKKGKNIPKEKVLDYIFGWTIGNDISERAWQRGDRTQWRCKNADTMKPMGPWIVTDPDLKNMRTTVRLNGAVTASFDTANMIFDVASIIAELTTCNTIYPGDVLWLGTDGETKNMEPGDKLEIEISGIGVLRNSIVADA